MDFVDVDNNDRPEAGPLPLVVSNWERTEVEGVVAGLGCPIPVSYSTIDIHRPEKIFVAAAEPLAEGEVRASVTWPEVCGDQDALKPGQENSRVLWRFVPVFGIRLPCIGGDRHLH